MDGHAIKAAAKKTNVFTMALFSIKAKQPLVKRKAVLLKQVC